MIAPTKKPKMAVEDIDQIRDDIRDIRNDIDKVKGDTHSINRILNLANGEKIAGDLVDLVGTSEYKAAILELTRDLISRGDLAAALGTDPRNLNKFLDPFLDKGYVSTQKRGRQLFYRRSESVDLIRIERIDDIWRLFEAWRRGKETIAPKGERVAETAPVSSSGSVSSTRSTIDQSESGLPPN